MINNDFLNNALKNSLRKIKAKVGVNSPALVEFTDEDKVVSYSIERVGDEGKFFGFGVCQKANVKLQDRARELSFITGSDVDISVGLSGEWFKPFPLYFITEVHRDENTNEVSITAYDALHKAAALKFADINIEAPYTIGDIITACAGVLGVGIIFPTEYENINPFLLDYQEGANLEGTETLREVLDAAAEATQTIYYINKENKLEFKQLIVEENPSLIIGREDYFTLESKTNRRLAAITNATELGDNVSVNTGLSGTEQFLRDNPFLDLRDDIDSLLLDALDRVGGITFNQFTCEWRGNPLLEIGDQIGLITKDNETVFSYVINDVIQYDGALSQKTAWNYVESEGESASNPTTLGETLKQTYAKVDKANKKISMIASDVETNNARLASIEIDTEKINSTVTKISTEAEGLSDDISTLTQQVKAAITAENVQIMINETLNDGVTSVNTTTGVIVDSRGLTVDKSNSEMSTTISEDGMAVYKSGDEMLTADSNGVKAKNLHAITYLIIGANSRFEDYEKDGEQRTGCFWIGG